MWPKTTRALALVLPVLVWGGLEVLRGDEDDEAPTVTIFFTGETRGVLEPCGCTSGQLGGIVRRDAYLERVRRLDPDALALDHGGLVDKPGRQDAIKFGVALAAMERMDYRVANVGKGDLLLGVDRVVEAAETSGIGFVSANLRLTGRGRPFPAYRVAKAGDVPVAVLGVLSPSHGPAVGAGGYLHLDDPVEVLGPAIEEALAEAKVLVLLAHVPVHEAIAIAEAHPALDVVLYGGDEDEPPAEAERVGRTLVAGCGAMGRHLGKVVLTLGPDGRPAASVAETVPMDESTGESARMKTLLEDYQDRLRLERLLEERSRGRHPRGAYVGSDNCKDCHEGPYAIWKKTAHSHAAETLETVGHDWDPECARCHTTGFEYETGYLSPESTPALGGVGCEACHGPGEEHAVTAGAVEMGKVGPARCRDCHDATQTPHFEFDTFFKRIAH